MLDSSESNEIQGQGWGQYARESPGHQSVLCSILIDGEMVTHFNGFFCALEASMDV